MRYNKALTKLDLPNLTQVGIGFLYWNKALTELKLPKVTQVGGWFLDSNRALTKLDLPNLPKVRECFSDMINRNLRNQATEAKKEIDAKSISELDKNNEMTTSEVVLGEEIIEGLKNPSKEIDNNEK